MFQFISIGSSAWRSCLAAASVSLALVGGTATAQTAPYPTGTGTATCASAATQAPATLDHYFTAYGSNAVDGVYTGCTVGIATFYNFVNLAARGIDPTQVFVTPSVVTVPFGSFALNVPTLSFSGPGLINTTEAPISLFFEYYIDPPIDILGLGLADDPFASFDTRVETDLCINNTFDAQRQTEADLCRRQSLSIFGGQLSDSTTFDLGVRFLDVRTTIVIAPHDSVLFSQNVQAQRVSDVPEPDPIALGGIGGLALFGALRMRRRTKGERP